jgi:hypothetical protein
MSRIEEGILRHAGEVSSSCEKNRLTSLLVLRLRCPPKDAFLSLCMEHVLPILLITQDLLMEKWMQMNEMDHHNFVDR